jgi:hypothetical protein
MEDKQGMLGPPRMHLCRSDWPIRIIMSALISGLCNVHLDMLKQVLHASLLMQALCVQA